MRISSGLLILLGVFCSCGPPGGSRGERARTGGASFRAVPLALLEAGENPLWFELTEGGPRQIGFPDEAELAPFAPWPLARHIRAIYPQGHLLILGVNRDGLLIFAPPEAGGLAPDRGIAVHRFASAYWERYSLAALFPEGEYVEALLYRDDFFAGPELPLPSPRIFALRPGGPKGPELSPGGFSAFDGFPPEEGWDIEALRFGYDESWYYRAVRKNADTPEIAYYRTDRLDIRGEAVSPGVFQNSVLPEPADAAPAPLRAVLEAAFAQSPGGLATVLFAGRAGPRYFSGNGSGNGEDSGTAGAGGLEIAGFYQEPDAGRAGAALAILPGGQGFFSAASGGEAALAPRPLALPALPPGFAYTAAAPCGDALIAAWEEQRDYAIGAAGFMVIRCPPAGESGERP